MGNGTGNGAANGAAGLDFKLPAEDQIRFRGVQQEIPHFGAPPKRTESLYMKPGEAAQPQLKAVGNSAMQRKKSLPDVAALPTVTVKQGSRAIPGKPRPLYLQPSHTGMVFSTTVDDGGPVRECDVSHYVFQIVNVRIRPTKPSKAFKSFSTSFAASKCPPSSSFQHVDAT